MDTKRKIFVVLGSVAVIAVAAVGGGALFFTKSNTQSSTQPSSSQMSSTSSSPSTSPAATPTTSSKSSYKDGTYTATSSYYVPHDGQNSIKATLTVANGTVTDVSVNDNYTDGESQSYIDFFEQEIKGAVVGKSLADLSPSRVGGASLTTEAFDQTLDTIKNDAAA